MQNQFQYSVPEGGDSRVFIKMDTLYIGFRLDKL